MAWRSWRMPPGGGVSVSRVASSSEAVTSRRSFTQTEKGNMSRATELPTKSAQ